MIAGCADVCPGTFRGPAWSPEMAPDSVRPRHARRHLGKTFYMAVQGGEVTADAAGAVGEHPERNSTARFSFALFILCKAGRTGEAECVLVDAPSAPGWVVSRTVHPILVLDESGRLASHRGPHGHVGLDAVICQYGNGEVVCRAGISPRGVATDPARVRVSWSAAARRPR